MQPVKDDPERLYRVVAAPGEGYTITKDDLAHFKSDDPRYVVRLMEMEGVNKLVLTFPAPAATKPPLLKARSRSGRAMPLTGTRRWRRR